MEGNEMNTTVSKINDESQVCWCMPVIPAIQEAKAGRSLFDNSPGKKLARFCVKNKINNKKRTTQVIESLLMGGPCPIPRTEKNTKKRKYFMFPEYWNDH
jgi:hypothetical protein